MGRTLLTGLLLLTCSAWFLFPPRTICPALSSPMVIWTLSDQPLMNQMPPPPSSLLWKCTYCLLILWKLVFREGFKVSSSPGNSEPVLKFMMFLKIEIYLLPLGAVTKSNDNSLQCLEAFWTTLTNNSKRGLLMPCVQVFTRWSMILWSESIVSPDGKFSLKSYLFIYLFAYIIGILGR